MKSIINFIIIIFITHVSNAQADKKFEYAGTLELSSKQLITFKIEFKEISPGIIEGTSLTDIYGKDKTASVIKGSINWSNNLISFKEESNINSQSKADPNTFCYISVTNAKINTIKGKSIITGKFNGQFPTGKDCESGSIYLIESNFINKVVKDPPKDLHKLADSLLNATKNNPNKDAKPATNILKNNDVLRINWESEEIIIEIWDSRNIDGDEIALYVNGNKVLDRFIMGPEKKTIIVPFKEKKGSIRIEALNEGKMKLCTANFTIRDGEANTEVVTVLKKKENVMVVLNKK